MRSVKIIATTLLGLLAQQAVADNRTPAELAQPIRPDYRAMDVSAKDGAQFVWVQRIEGRDSDGNTQLLFDDMQGALLPISQLSQADRLINPQQVNHKGKYQELQLQLAPRALTVSARGMKRSPLPDGIHRKMVLNGDIEVTKFEVSSRGLSLQPESQGKLALLNR